MSRQERPIHVAAGRTVEGISHRPDPACACSPVQGRDMTDGAPAGGARRIWLHRPLIEADATGPLAPAVEPFAIERRS